MFSRCSLPCKVRSENQDVVGVQQDVLKIPLFGCWLSFKHSARDAVVCAWID